MKVWPKGQVSYSSMWYFTTNFRHNPPLKNPIEHLTSWAWDYVIKTNDLDNMQSQNLGLPLTFQLEEEMCIMPQVFLKMAPWASGHGANHKSSFLWFKLERGARGSGSDRGVLVSNRGRATLLHRMESRKMVSKGDPWRTSEDGVSLRDSGKR